jgi:hypothetical protein
VGSVSSAGRPLIGVSTYLEAGARWSVLELEAALLPAGYHRLVQAAGVSPRCCRRTTPPTPRRPSPVSTAS